MAVSNMAYSRKKGPQVNPAQAVFVVPWGGFVATLPGTGDAA
jgi:hypothetical protein